ncbi:Hypothetical_protein [Hexamita inflata]|uniref:Hypothetical_protein n=1 Tax=Hexamita inflata TaxID=28002 RepID=A0AA86PQD3_9EUKA|nr:Hypothetical protein HINF_LOCUS5683 [Hexamita inflata]CAI9923047.1 Hypothetical protein HINF_LOCUS10692 [Hexamita inflata]CAI9928381.1 Hypothetical protein HINF_LOCUS16026 [Hexamita inflata]CAI9942801.1 Hypothetical protein HINF_LOCUS30446 [Hexamita inflata]
MEDSELSQLLKPNNLNNSSLSISETPFQSTNPEPKFYQDKRKLTIFTVFSALFLVLSSVSLYFAITMKSQFQTVLIFGCVLLVNVSAFCVFSSVVWCCKNKHGEQEDVELA